MKGFDFIIGVMLGIFGTIGVFLVVDGFSLSRWLRGRDR